MNLDIQFIQRKIKINKIGFGNSPALPIMAQAQQRLQPSVNNAPDYYMPILLKRTSRIIEYVDVKKDETIFTIERQNVNPFFSELGFFDNVVRIKPNTYSNFQGSSKVKEFIREEFAGTITESEIDTDLKLKKWYNNIGINSFADKKYIQNSDNIQESEVMEEIFKNEPYSENIPPYIKKILDKNDTNSDVMSKININEINETELIAKAKLFSIFINK